MLTTVIPSDQGENPNLMREEMINTTTSSDNIKLSIFDKFVGRTVEAGIAELPLIKLNKGWKSPVAQSKLKLPDGTLNPIYKLTVEQAQESLKSGWNIGCYGAPEGIEIHDIDLEDGEFLIPSDKLEELVEAFDTLTIMTRSGGYDFIFKNSGHAKNPHIWYNGTTDAGERRCFWQYAVCAGSFVNKNEPNPDNGKTKGFTDNATGFYEIIRDVPIREYDPLKAPDWYKFEEIKTQRKRKQSTISTPPLTDENIIAKATSSKIGVEFTKLMRGEFTTDRSSADMTLANYIAFYTNDRKQIERLMTTPERLAKNDKALRDAYLQSTIDKAIEDISRPMYNPNYHAENNAALGLTEHNSTISDFGNEQRMLKLYPNGILYDTPNKTWFLWNTKEGRWKPDVGMEISEMVKTMIRGIRVEAEEFAARATAVEGDSEEAKAEREKWSILAQTHITWWNKCQNPQKVNACLELLKSSLSVLPTDFNKDDNLFNCKNGTLNLRTGDLIPHNPDDRITYSCGWVYDKNATCPSFVTFITRLFASHPDKDELIRYMRMVYGYCLSGSTDHQIVDLLTGSGENGKSVLSASIYAQFGDYAATLKGESFTTLSRSKIREDIAQLVGKRYLSVTESPKGVTIDEDIVKNITGGSGEAVKVRELYGKSFNFYPKCKIFWSFNHTPNVTDMTHSLWRRLKFIPFDEVIDASERRSMTDILAEHDKERSGILNWLVEGYRDLQKTGNFNWCNAVVKRTDESREESDTLKPFIDEVCDVWNPDEHVGVVIPTDWFCRAKQLHDAYQGWAFLNGYRYPLNQTTFGREITERIGRKNKERNKDGVIYRSLKMKATVCYINPQVSRYSKLYDLV